VVAGGGASTSKNESLLASNFAASCCSCCCSLSGCQKCRICMLTDSGIFGSIITTRSSGCSERK
jgi:hypothetical protein